MKCLCGRYEVVMKCLCGRYDVGYHIDLQRSGIACRSPRPCWHELQPSGCETPPCSKHV